MRINTTSIALLALPALTLAGPNDPVALFDFKPRVENVSGDCNNVYEQKVPGCFGRDFGQQGCSVECVKGLESMTQLVKDSCSNDGLQDSDKDLNILAYFLGGDGPQSVCTNANKVLQSLSSSAAESTTSQQRSSTPTSTQQTTDSIVSSTMTASATDVPTSIVMDTSNSPQSTSSASSTKTGEQSDTSSSTTSQIFEAPSMPSTWSMASASSTSSPSSRGHSGGGSPFDDEGNEFSAATSITSSVVTLALAVMFAALAAHW